MTPGARASHMVLVKNLTLPEPPEENEPSEPVKPIEQKPQQMASLSIQSNCAYIC